MSSGFTATNGQIRVGLQAVWFQRPHPGPLYCTVSPFSPTPSHYFTHPLQVTHFSTTPSSPEDLTCLGGALFTVQHPTPGSSLSSVPASIPWSVIIPLSLLPYPAPLSLGQRAQLNPSPEKPNSAAALTQPN